MPAPVTGETVRIALETGSGTGEIEFGGARALATTSGGNALFDPSDSSHAENATIWAENTIFIIFAATARQMRHPWKANCIRQYPVCQ